MKKIKRAIRNFYYKHPHIFAGGIVFVTLIIAAILFFIIKSEKGITGKEWIGKQYTYLNDIKTFSYGMDDVYSLYLTGSIDSTSFVQEVSVLKSEWNLMEKNYQKFLDNYPILPTKNSYVSKRGQLGIENLRKYITNLLATTVVDGVPLDKEELLYTYISYGENVNNAISEYVVAYRWLCEADKLDTDFEKALEYFDN